MGQCTAVSYAGKWQATTEAVGLGGEGAGAIMCVIMSLKRRLQ